MTHEYHPGHDAVCRARLTINAAPHSTASNGYACKVSGGHCLPGTRCAEMLKIFDAHKAREARFT